MQSLNVRTQLINAMFRSLYHEGYHACNLNDMLKRAGSSKGGLYHYFGSKQELALCVIDEVLAQYLQTHWIEPLQLCDDPISLIESKASSITQLVWIDNVAFEFCYGSPLGRFIQELSHLDQTIRSKLIELSDAWWTALSESFQRSIDNKKIRSDISADEMAMFAISSIEGLHSMAKLYDDADMFDRGYALICTSLNGLKSGSKSSSKTVKKATSLSLFD